jgi:hypothetical protein
MNFRSLNVKHTLFSALAVASLTILPTTAQAVPISGELNLSGRVTVDATTITWLDLGGAGGTWDFHVLDGEGGFALWDATYGEALDLDAAAQPVGVPISLPNFLTFSADPTVTFELTYIAPCDAADCLFPNTPFNAYEQTIGGVTRTTVELAMSGIVTNALGEQSFWTGTWANAFDRTTIAQLQAAFGEGGPGFITAPYATDITVEATAVPEPMTLLTFGAGTAVLAAHRRRRAKKTA